MRLHRLELAAFGPFAGPQEIDFDRLAGAGLFLLEGPTGAGKSTVLDAITFALYGGLAGEDAGSDRLHSHFAPPDREPSVTLEFSVRGVRYLITRVPEYRRPKRRGDGYTTEAMRVHLRRRENGRWVSLSANKAETGDLIADVVGLSRTQFTQVMLLPQGEFARFLQCDDDARRAVLTKLFGTELYDSITTELDQRRAAAVKRCQAAERAVADAVSAAAEAAGLDAAARGELIALPAAEQDARFERMEHEATAALAAAAAALTVAARDARQAEAAEREAATQATLMTRLTSALTALAAHQGAEPEHRERAARLDAARRADPVRPLLGALADANAAAATARAGLRAVLGTGQDPGQPGAKAGGGAAEADSMGTRLLGLIADPDDGAGPDPAAVGFARNLAGEATARADAAREQAMALTHLAEEETGVSGRSAAVRELDRAAVAARELAATLAAARQQLPDAIAGADKQLAGARAGAAALDGVRQRQLALAALRDAADRQELLRPGLEAAAAALRTAADRHQRATDEHQAAMDARLAGLAAELAAGLTDGTACPVCGSCQHPAPAAGDIAPVTAEAVAAARTARDTAERARRVAERAHADLDRQMAECAAITAGHTSADLAAEAAAIAGQVAEAEHAAAAVPGLERELAGLRERQERLAAELSAAQAAERTASRDAGRASADLETLIGRLGSASDGYPSVRARQAGLRRAADEDATLAGTLEALAAALETAGQARGRAEDEARARGFGSLAQASAAVLNPAGQSALAAQVDQWATTLTALRAAAEAPELSGLDPDGAGEARLVAEAAAAALVTARQAAQAAVSAHDSQRRRAERLRSRLAEVRAARDRGGRPGRGDRPGDLPGRPGQGHGRAPQDRAHHLRAAALVRAGRRGGQHPAHGHVVWPVRAAPQRRGRVAAAAGRADAVGHRPAYRRGARPEVAVGRRDVLHLARARARARRRGQGAGRGSGDRRRCSSTRASARSMPRPWTRCSASSTSCGTAAGRSASSATSPT